MKGILYPLRRIHGAIHDKWIFYNKKKEIKKIFYKNPNTVFLVFTPEHGNLGDHAIAQAEAILLKKLDVNYIEISGRQLREMMTRNEINLMNGFPILINGGGNLGTLWMDVEIIERAIIEKNPKSPIMILPNTIYYEQSAFGKEEFEKSKVVYNDHKKLLLFARERLSFDVMKETYHNVKLVPDMVLSLNKCKSGINRNGCLICLRGDRERTRTPEQDEIIVQQTRLLFGDNYEVTDMVVPHSVLVYQRDEELEKKFNQFRSAELVITDRLHGMIFAAITGTSCIVIDSKSPKLRGCYEWIKNLNYIRFANDPSLIMEEFKKIPSDEHKYDNSHLLPYYEELKSDIIQLTSKRKA